MIRPSFRPNRSDSNAEQRRSAWMAVLLLIVSALLLSRHVWLPEVGSAILVEVSGDVERPGWHRVEPPTVRAALMAAGGSAVWADDAVLHEGDHVDVQSDGVQVAPSGHSLLVALPVNINTASTTSLAAVPGLGPSTAKAIVESREADGSFYTLAELERVNGIGPSRTKDLSVFLTVGEVGPPPKRVPMALNTATADELVRLPGVGPVLAARIVADRDVHGPYRHLRSLQRVRGVGPSLVGKLAETELRVNPDDKAP